MKHKDQTLVWSMAVGHNIDSKIEELDKQASEEAR